MSDAIPDDIKAKAEEISYRHMREHIYSAPLKLEIAQALLAERQAAATRLRDALLSAEVIEAGINAGCDLNRDQPAKVWLAGICEAMAYAAQAAAPRTIDDAMVERALSQYWTGVLEEHSRRRPRARMRAALEAALKTPAKPEPMRYHDLARWLLAQVGNGNTEAVKTVTTALESINATWDQSKVPEIGR